MEKQAKKHNPLCKWQFTVLVSYDGTAKHRKVPVTIVAEAGSIIAAVQKIDEAHPRLLDRGFSVVELADI